MYAFLPAKSECEFCFCLFYTENPDNPAKNGNSKNSNNCSIATKIRVSMGNLFFIIIFFFFWGGGGNSRIGRFEKKNHLSGKTLVIRKNIIHLTQKRLCLILAASPLRGKILKSI